MRKQGEAFKKKVPREAHNNLAKNLFMEVFVILEGGLVFWNRGEKTGFTRFSFFVFFGIPLCLRGGRGVAPSFSALGPMSPFVLLQRRGGEGEISMRTTDDFHPPSPRPNPVFPIGRSVSREPAVKVERRLRKQRKHPLKTLTFPQDFFLTRGVRGV